MSDLPYRDLVGLVEHDDPAETLMDSYEVATRIAIAVLQHTGRRKVPADWLERTDGFIVTATPQRDGTVLLEAVRRGEVTGDSREVQERLRAAWERRYGAGGAA